MAVAISHDHFIKRASAGSRVAAAGREGAGRVENRRRRGARIHILCAGAAEARRAQKYAQKSNETCRMPRCEDEACEEDHSVASNEYPNTQFWSTEVKAGGEGVPISLTACGAFVGKRVLV